MHREVSHADDAFASPSSLSLYLLTAVLGVLLLLDLWPALAVWLRSQGVDAPTWERTFYGYRYALIAAVLGGARVLYGSLESLMEGRVGADLALGIACIAAILIREPLVAAEVVFIGLVGESLEAYTFARTQRSIGKLVELFPVRCWLLRDGEEVRVLTADVQVGDRVVVKPGGRIPVDGVVTDGESSLDVSALTGESVPVGKRVGDEVLAGCVNLMGALTIDARRVQKQTVAGQVIEMTGRALKDKSPIQRHADRLASYFLPVVLALAALTFLANLAFYAGPFRAESTRLGMSAASRVSAYPALSVLVVACPCALILATPAAVIAALGRLAGTGVLIKGGAVLERLASVTTFAFDKTGTLTEGKLELGDVLTFNDASTDDVLRWAASAEQNSEHPLGRLIVAEARNRGLTLDAPTAFRAHPGGGVSATLAEDVVIVGTARLLREQGIAVGDDTFAPLDASGQTPMLVARNGVVVGAIGARDRVRPEAAGVVEELRELGIAAVMVTGDRAAVANAVRTHVPALRDVHAELLPADKSAFVDVKTVMVGDGVNDAPALAKAGVGIAIGSGTDIAAEAGDVVMMGEPLRPLPFLVRLSRETTRIIRQNIIVFAFGVNLVGVVITAWLWPLFATSPEWYESGPVAAVLYHQLGSLLVLLNSMRLLAFERNLAKSAGVSSTLKNVDAWMERNFRVDDLLHDAAHHWKRLTAAVAGLALLGWSLSGLTRVGPDEVGVVQRFGRVEGDIGPGLSWRWPWPIEAVTKVKTTAVRTVEVGFRLPAEGERTGPGGLAWASVHEGGSRRLSDESVMVTGDGNLVEVLATVRYTVDDPRRFLFGARDPEAVLRWSAESVLREMVAGERFTDLLTVGRAGFQRDAQQRLELRLRDVSPDGLGLRVDGLTLHDLHPPQEVVAAYHEVARATELRDRVVNEATADAFRTRSRAHEESVTMIAQAQAARDARVADAEAARDVFLAWHRARAGTDALFESARFFAYQGVALGGVDPYVASADFRATEWPNAERRALIAFRLQLDAVTGVLRKRDKVLIDSDKLPGRRQLFLMDPDAMRLPAIAAPADRGTRPIRPADGDGP